jgi:hypothetical protein
MAVIDAGKKHNMRCAGSRRANHRIGGYGEEQPRLPS